MNFWEIGCLPDDPLVIDDQIEKQWLPGELQIHIDKLKNVFASRKKLMMILCGNNIASIIGYLAGLQAKQAVILIDINIKENHLSMLIKEYQPEFILMPLSRAQSTHYTNQFTLFDYCFYQYNTECDEVGEIYDDLAVMLATSGSTGNPKFVRLSYKNLQENAKSIATYLKLSSQERPITSLQMHYSYGLSVINSHLLVGARILLTSHNMLMRDFWKFACKYRATSISGVPYVYEMLKRINFQDLAPKSLRVLTQAGGKLNEALVKYYYTLSQQNKWKFYIMYGQTEATARISYVPLGKQIDKFSSIGVAIPGGELSLNPQTSEIVYHGPNVMLGYANKRSDLIRGDELNGILNTGDIGRKDDDGFYYIVGRKKRFVKLFGKRMNLDDIEEALKNKFDCFFACIGDDKKLYLFMVDDFLQQEINDFLLQTFDIHNSAIEIRKILQMPVHSNNKIDYHKLKEIVVA